ncbi:class I SAM-dependent methyltransferase [Dictyobacter arantiisoli]|uniref:Methyltransferase n=1 Tax=Dictyobacter arantiisoli TaxID=2014874 RepID=A0A5A5TL48_9CHLR|nr:class I SAM-dependent methyltransferase [Dictyobacter arantiisoli]GCF11846.1 hypothetical protein KDI_54100 [Dictyobacter arantiisoli]
MVRSRTDSRTSTELAQQLYRREQVRRINGRDVTVVDVRPESDTYAQPDDYHYAQPDRYPLVQPNDYRYVQPGDYRYIQPDQALVREPARTEAQKVPQELLIGFDQLAPDMRFDAATCLYVLHFLPDAAKLELLRNIRDRLQPGAPLYLISPVRGDETKFGVTNPTLRADFLGAWQYHGELMGMPKEQMAGIVAQLTEQMSQPQVATADSVQELLHEAGFRQVAPFFSMLGTMYGWIAR